MCVWFDPERGRGRCGLQARYSVRFGGVCKSGQIVEWVFLDGCNHDGHSASDKLQIQLSVFLLLLLLLGTRYYFTTGPIGTSNLEARSHSERQAMWRQQQQWGRSR